MFLLLGTFSVIRILHYTQNSIPPPSWEGVQDATEFETVCAQPDLTGKYNGEEDCLYLNVYTPKV